MSHTPWTQEQAEKWAREEWERFKEANPPKGQAQFYYKDNREYFLDGFKIALAKAAEMIEERDGSRRRKQHGNAVLVSIENE